MKRSDFYVTAKRLNVDVADCTKCDSTVRLKPVDQAFTFDFMVKLLFDGNERFGWDAFQLDLRLVPDLILQRRCVVAGALNRVRKQNLVDWKGMVRSRTDFGQHHAIMHE